MGPEHLDLQVSTHEAYQPKDVRILHREAPEGKYFPITAAFVRSYPSGALQP
jgi:hypothetical protein